MLLELVTTLLLATTPPPEDIEVETAAPEAALLYAPPNSSGGLPLSVRYQALDGNVRPLSDGPLEAVVVTGMVAPGDGYAPLRVKLKNNTNKTVPVRLRIEGNAGADLKRVVELAPGERRQVLLPLPPAIRYGTIVLDSPVLERPATDHIQSAPDKTSEFLFVGAPSAVAEWLGEQPDKDAYSATHGVLTLDGSELWEEFPGYVGFDAIVLVRSSFLELPRPVQRALEAYVATGGLLVLTTAERGLANALPLLPASLPPKVIIPYGLGVVGVCERAEGCLPFFAPSVYEPAVKPVSNAYNQDALLSEPGTPVGPFLLMMLAFALVVGPGSVWVARNRGALLLLFFIPIMSIVTVVLLVTYSIASDGFGVDGAIQGVTYLDTKNHRAYSVGVGGFYANVVPKGPRLGTFEAVIGEANRYDPAGVSIDWSDGTQFGSNFLRTRTYQEWGLRSAVESRARVSVSASGGDVKLQNALGAPVEALYVRHGGELFEVGKLADGREATARRGQKADDAKTVHTPNHTHRRFSSEILTRTQESLREGEFLALLEKPAPWLNFGSLSLDLEPGWHLVRGEVAR